MTCLLTFSGEDPDHYSGVDMDQRVTQALGIRTISIITSSNHWLASQSIKKLGVVPAQIPSQREYASWLQAGCYYIKIGQVPTADWLAYIQGYIEFVHQRNQPVYVVWDPVLATSSGQSLIQGDLKLWIAAALSLASQVSLLTPNHAELNHLNSFVPVDQPWQSLAPWLLVTGSDRAQAQSNPKITHELLHQGQPHTNYQQPLLTGSYRGTGCLLSTIIASGWMLDPEASFGCLPGASRDALNSFAAYIKLRLQAVARCLETATRIQDNVFTPDTEQLRTLKAQRGIKNPSEITSTSQL